MRVGMRRGRQTTFPLTEAEREEEDMRLRFETYECSMMHDMFMLKYAKFYFIEGLIN
jgi:hypothetical protein